LTPRQRTVLTEVLNGLFIVACIGLLILLVRGYHALVLILVGVTFGVGRLTFRYDRTNTLMGLAVFAGIGFMGLGMAGYHILAMMLLGIIGGISAVVSGGPKHGQRLFILRRRGRLQDGQWRRRLARRQPLSRRIDGGQP